MLDPKGRREVIAAVHKLNREEGITVVYITHMMEEAVAAHRVLVMDQGSIAMDGTPLEVFSQVRQLKDLRLDAPLAVEMAYRLRQNGHDLPESILTMEELAAVLAAGWTKHSGSNSASEVQPCQ